MYQIETFKKIKPEKKIKKNNIYGTSGNIGKNYSTRSFGGGMSNRKYTKKQVKKHKLLPNNERTGEVSNIKPDKKKLVPPLYPTTLGSTGPNNRSGYINPNSTTTVPNPNNIDKYIYPSQELENVNMEVVDDPNKYSISIKNVNNNDINSLDGNGYGGYNGSRWADYTYNGGYYGPNPWFSYNPYLYGPNPFDDNNKNNIIINNYKKDIVEDMEDIKKPHKHNEHHNNDKKHYYEYIYYITAIIVLLIILFIMTK